MRQACKDTAEESVQIMHHLGMELSNKERYLKTASAEPRKSKEDATHEKQSRGWGPLDVFAEPMEPEAYF